MRHALSLTGPLVIGIAIRPEVDVGTRVEHTTYPADYDSYEGRMGDLVNNQAIHHSAITSDSHALTFGRSLRSGLRHQVAYGN
jgi:hypothetical protein